MTSLRPTQKAVLVALERSEVVYLLDHMLTDDLRSHPNPGAATVIRQIVADAITRHKNETQALKAQLASIGQPDRRRLMAGR
jgi:hypothetical protein